MWDAILCQFSSNLCFALAISKLLSGISPALPQCQHYQIHRIIEYTELEGTHGFLLWGSLVSQAFENSEFPIESILCLNMTYRTSVFGEESGEILNKSINYFTNCMGTCTQSCALVIDVGNQALLHFRMPTGSRGGLSDPSNTQCLLSDRSHSTDTGRSSKAACLGGSTFKITLHRNLSLIIRPPWSPKTEDFIVFLEVGYVCEGCSAMAADLRLQTSHGCADPPASGCLLLL